jgi:DNA-binding MarR family transcriptional regulator
VSATGSGEGSREGSREGSGDDVDRIVAAWRRERPELDTTPLEVFSRVSRLARRLDRARGEAFAEHGLEGWEFDVHAALRRSGPPYELSPGRLGAQMLVTSGTVTNRVDRLAARGYVERERSEADRRGVIVRLTRAGMRTVDAALDDLLERERTLLADLTPAAGTALASQLRTLLAPFERSGVVRRPDEVITAPGDR